MPTSQPTPDAKLYGLRYILSYLQSKSQSRQHDDSLLDQLLLLSLIEQLTGQYKSQLGQDVFALAMSGFRRGGYFVEVGAHHGEGLSNTWLLETRYDWDGLLVEPYPIHLSSLEARRATLIKKAAWKRSGETLQFHATKDAALASLATVAQNPPVANAPALWRQLGRTLKSPSAIRDALFPTARVAKHDRNDFDVQTVETMTLDDILAANGAPAKIDFISIDVEGAELDVLEGLDLEKWDVQALTLEHDNDSTRIAEFDRCLGRYGYVRAFDVVSDFDGYYVKPATLAAWRQRYRLPI